MRYNVYKVIRMSPPGESNDKVTYEHLASFSNKFDAESFLNSKLSGYGAAVILMLVDGTIESALKGDRA